MEGPPPPPPPHGENPRTTRSSGLPDGKYDIFVIPPHSAGSGFLYLPSLNTQRNSFLAGCVCTAALFFFYSVAMPVAKDWFYTTVNGGGSGVIMLVLGVGVVSWALGKTQGESTGGPTSTSAAGGASSSSGAYADPPPKPQPGYSSYHSPPPQPPPREPTPPPAPGSEAKPEPKQPPEESKSRPQSPPPRSKWQRSAPSTDAKSAWEKAREETRKREEEKKRAAEIQRRRDELEKERQRQREKETLERLEREWKEKKAKEDAAAKTAEAENKAQQVKDEADKRTQREKERREREAREALLKAAKEAREAKEALEKTRKEDEERRKKEEQEKKEADAKAAEERRRNLEEARKAAEARSAKASNLSSNKRPPMPSARTEQDDDAYSFRPYDRSRATQKSSSGSVYSDDSYAPSATTARTTPPPSTRGPYTTKDPDKIIIKGVYSFNNAFMRTPISQLISGQGNVTDGLILRITTEGLFIDDDVRGIPQREWDVKAWTMKLAESVELQGHLVLRASIRDQEGKKYVFILSQTEGWKVAVGLQRLRKGSQVRALGVAGMPMNEARMLLESLGWG
ncbi:hypothetical protein LTR64_003957 [Lithohypha guttulata]|uniref:uncharacterized protein n=1 Tax=Lithohypha guttulata TaxID=1690604 RepID=UPI002DDDC4D2|nr:hypothetical protein LTR51_006995 [Lithohypha guttulata]